MPVYTINVFLQCKYFVHYVKRMSPLAAVIPSFFLKKSVQGFMDLYLPSTVVDNYTFLTVLLK